jgi:hypothetical protein
MPPRSVCLNVFTTSLGDSSSAVRNDGRPNDTFGRRDSAQSSLEDDRRRSSSGSNHSTPAMTSPPAFNRADFFPTLRSTASTESMNSAHAFASKPCAKCSGSMAKLRCSRCKTAYYCDKACQKSAWKSHRTVCEPATQGYSAPATPNISNPASPVPES